MVRELRTFLAVGRYGTFSKTGSRIGLTQSAVSAQIQRLERQLGYALFDRVGRSAVLNAAGREMLVRADELVALFDGLPRPSASTAPAVLRVGAIASVQAHALPDALVALRAAHPSMRVKIVPGVSLAFMSLVDAGDLDAAVMIRPHFDLPPELVWRPLWDEPFVLAVPARMRGKDWKAMLRRQPFLRYDRGSFGGRLVAQFLDAEAVEVQDAVEMDEIAGLVRLVGKGAGVALIPRCRPYFPLPPEVRAVALHRDDLRREIGLVERRRHRQMALVDALHRALAVAEH
ncbi:LysR family transcriptional regulator [Xylophilus sp. Kf1]|nr:LysR family transcriptional regulator [Xylophilus sp. Kf1]